VLEEIRRPRTECRYQFGRSAYLLVGLFDSRLRRERCGVSWELQSGDCPQECPELGAEIRPNATSRPIAIEYRPLVGADDGSVEEEGGFSPKCS